MELMEHQKDAIKRLGNGKILWGGVGTGKSATSLGYYMEKEAPRDIYVITTAKKRDSLDWQGEAARFGIGTVAGATVAGVLTVDSWNGLHKYVDVKDAFFIFDEQRLVGYGAWAKAFLKIAKKNHWILLSATPGDTWMDYATVFIANGFYKNITEFKMQHVLYAPYVKFPQIRGYLNERKLEVLRNDMLVEMPFVRTTERYLNYLEVGHDEELYRSIYVNRWHPWEDRPVKDAAEVTRLMRRAVNSDPSRLAMVRDLMKVHPRLIIFYNFNYELDILRTLKDEITVAEWNGHVKQPVPETANWVYLVQYISGAESWNCTATDAMIMYSQSYSYKNFEQAQGRIDRLNTSFSKLYYYIFVSNSVIDRSIKESVSRKEDFNDRKLIEILGQKMGTEHAPKDEFSESCQI